MIFAETILAISFALLALVVVYGMIKNRKIIFS